MPSTNDIKNFKEEIIEQKKIYSEYISLIDEWKKKIKYKLEQYQQNLIDKIIFIRFFKI